LHAIEEVGEMESNKIENEKIGQWMNPRKLGKIEHLILVYEKVEKIQQLM
jgi:hypothetical protein